VWLYAILSTCSITAKVNFVTRKFARLRQKETRREVGSRSQAVGEGRLRLGVAVCYSWHLQHHGRGELCDEEVCEIEAGGDQA
jgi:hypothetical protein